MMRMRELVARGAAEHQASFAVKLLLHVVFWGTPLMGVWYCLLPMLQLCVLAAKCPAVTTAPSPCCEAPHYNFEPEQFSRTLSRLAAAVVGMTGRHRPGLPCLHAGVVLSHPWLIYVHPVCNTSLLIPACFGPAYATATKTSICCICES